jgi:hypothetical protein
MKNMEIFDVSTVESESSLWITGDAISHFLRLSSNRGRLAPVVHVFPGSRVAQYAAIRREHPPGDTAGGEK